MNNPAQSFEDLNVWRKAHEFTLAVYRLTWEFPAEERFGLTPQLRRAAISIPANIAEGFKKRSMADKARYMNIAQGSAEESHYYLILARDLGYAVVTDLVSLLDEVGRMLTAYAKAIISH
jgi:four helix bundle protein